VLLVAVVGLCAGCGAAGTADGPAAPPSDRVAMAPPAASAAAKGPAAAPAESPALADGRFPADFALDVTVLLGPGAPELLAVQDRQAKYILLPDGSLHADASPFVGMETRPGRTRWLYEDQVQFVWSICGQVGFLDAAAANGPANPDVLRAGRDERMAVITYCGAVLAQAGLWDESDALLKANLGRAQAPYYLMSQLGSNARKLGRPAEALRWYREAYETSIGPATRLQWGAAYLVALVDLAPKEAQPIEELAARLITQAGQDSSAFYERSGRSMQRVAAKLRDWNQGGGQSAVLGRLRAQLAPVCARLPSGDEQRASCEAVAKLI
jgi:hypothetical protein